jgi:hypothetical protein
MSFSSLATVAATPAAGFYLRNNLADTGSGAQAAPYCQSPDIIQSDMPVLNPQLVLPTAESWTQAYNAAPVTDVNYYYVRGRNGGATPASPQVSFFALPAQLIPWPSLWGKPIPTADGHTSAALGHLEPGAIGVTSAPFRWIPEPLSTAGCFHAMVAWCTHSAHTAPVPAVESFADMATLMSATPGLAINQLTCLDADAGPWLVRVGLSIPAGVRDAQPVAILLSGSGLNGATVGVLGDTFTATRQQLLLPPQVPPDGVAIGFTAPLEAGYQGSLAIQIWPGALPPGNGGTLTMQALYPVPPYQLAQAALRGTLTPAGRHLQSLGITPRAMSPLGEVTISFSRG